MPITKKSEIQVLRSRATDLTKQNDKLLNQRRDLSVAINNIVDNAMPCAGGSNNRIIGDCWIKDAVKAYAKIWRKP